MNNTNNDYEHLIARFLNGELSEIDSKKLLNWIDEAAENKKLFFRIKDVWDASLKKEIKDTEQLLLFYKKKAINSKKSLYTYLKVGIAAAAILIFGLLIGNLISDTSHEKQSVEQYLVPIGSRSCLTLNDGTVVNLNSDTRLEIDKNYSKGNRHVKLYGEAYFEVKSDKKNPFIVETEKFKIKVTGTKFNVCSYPDITQISATLVEGKVQLTTENQTYNLLPGEKILFDQKTMKSTIQQVDAPSESAWIDGNFIFHDILFPDLMKILEKRYNVKFQFSTKDLEKITYSGSFKNQETILQILDALKLTSPVDYEKISPRQFKIKYLPM